MGRLKNTLLLADEFLQPVKTGSENAQVTSEVTTMLTNLENQFVEALDDDFNTALAIGHLFELARLINSQVASLDPVSAADQMAVKQGAELLRRLGGILGIFSESAAAGTSGSEDEGGKLDEVLQSFLAIRAQARKNKNYALADGIRDFLSGQGIRIEDTSGGARCRYDTAPDLAVLLAKLAEWQGGPA